MASLRRGPVAIFNSSDGGSVSRKSKLMRDHSFESTVKQLMPLPKSDPTLLLSKRGVQKAQEPSNPPFSGTGVFKPSLNIAILPISGQIFIF